MRGLDIFRKRFSKYPDRYVLIGGTACDIALGAAGIAYRATRDLDIVLCIEALKAVAWVRQTSRRGSGEAVHDNDIRKHMNDIFRLYQVIRPSERIGIPRQVMEDLQSFLLAAENDASIDPASLGIRGVTAAEACAKLREIYRIDPAGTSGALASGRSLPGDVNR